MGISDEERIIHELDKSAKQKLTFEQLAEKLGKSSSKWTVDVVKEKVRALDAASDVPIFIVHGGVEFHGDENHPSPAIYEAVRDGFRKWGNDRGLAGALPLRHRSLSELVVGKWTNPDLAFRVPRRAGADPAEHYHSLEIEQSEGFNVVSVYQAYEQGWGSHFRWVFFQGSESVDHRILRAAKDIGVGLVAMPRPRTPSGWKLVNNAREQPVTKKALKDFLERVQ